MPAKFPSLFSGGARKPWKGILLYGAPGTGKSFLAKAVASSIDATFLSVSSADLVSKWQGESERLIRQMFALAEENKPAILFIDEVDSIAGKRRDDERPASRRIKNEFLVRMQDLRDSEGVLVLACTNRPMDLDSAVLRRFDKRIYIPLPDAEVRRAMLRIHLGKEASSLTEEQWETVVDATAGFSGSDISSLVRDALMVPVRKAVKATHFRGITKPDGSPGIIACSPDDQGAIPMSLFDITDTAALSVPPITVDDFEEGLTNIRPSVGESDLDALHAWTRKYAPRQRRPSFELSDVDEDDEGHAAAGGAGSSSSLAPPPSSSSSRKRKKRKHKRRPAAAAGM